MDKETMDRQFTEQVARWLIAAAIACVALIGIVLLVGALVVALDPPMWIATAVGTLLAIGTAAFAWLVATALGSSRKEGQDRTPPRGVTRLPRDD